MSKIIEIPWIEPLLVAQALRGLQSVAYLDSAMFHKEYGRYSFVTADPFLEIESRGGVAFVNGRSRAGDPVDVLEAELARYTTASVPGLPPFQGGAVGYFGYDLSVNYEGKAPAQRLTGNELHFAFYDIIVAFDHVDRHAWIVSTGFPETDPTQREVRADARAGSFAEIVEYARTVSVPNFDIAPLDWTSNFDARSYAVAVERVREHIKAGDIFQANISQRFTANLPPDFDPWAFYARARQINASTFGAYLEFGDLSVACCSPERFLRIFQGRVETRPIKGTIRRSEENPDRDRELAEELANSAKDRAENVMIVDLLRNDLSRSCQPESVNVETLCSVETYAGLHHLVSSISGTLHQDASPLRLLRECFPGGSITGAPKIRAMEVIADIEQVGRGIYCGSIGYVGFDNSVDTNIGIRTVLFRSGEATFNVGGGITLLSDPNAEYTETLVKANKIFSSFNADHHDVPDH